MDPAGGRFVATDSPYLPLGIAIEALGMIIDDAGLVDAPSWVPQAVHVVGVPILDLGYATGLILLFHSSRFGILARMFGPVGRMALTNYLVQGMFIELALYGFHGGLAWQARSSPRSCCRYALAFLPCRSCLASCGWHAIVTVRWNGCGARSLMGSGPPCVLSPPEPPLVGPAVRGSSSPQLSSTGRRRHRCRARAGSGQALKCRPRRQCWRRP